MKKKSVVYKAWEEAKMKHYQLMADSFFSNPTLTEIMDKIEKKREIEKRKAEERGAI